MWVNDIIVSLLANVRMPLEMCVCMWGCTLCACVLERGCIVEGKKQGEKILNVQSSAENNFGICVRVLQIST